MPSDCDLSGVGRVSMMVQPDSLALPVRPQRGQAGLRVDPEGIVIRPGFDHVPAGSQQAGPVNGTKLVMQRQSPASPAKFYAQNGRLALVPLSSNELTRDGLPMLGWANAHGES